MNIVCKFFLSLSHTLFCITAIRNGYCFNYRKCKKRRRDYYCEKVEFVWKNFLWLGGITQRDN